jgi:hypothetical protein
MTKELKLMVMLIVLIAISRMIKTNAWILIIATFPGMLFTTVVSNI